MSAPEIEQKFWRIYLNLLEISREAPPNKRESSANKAWLIGSSPCKTLMPGTVPNFYSTINFLLRESAIRMNIKGERGKPCHNPLEA